jgi:hypothetical protein
MGYRPAKQAELHRTLIPTTRRSKTSVIYVDGTTVAILKRWIARHSLSLPRLP